MLPPEVVYPILLSPQKFSSSPRPYIKGDEPDSRDPKQSDQMDSNTCSLVASLLAIPSPLVDLSPSSAYPQPAANSRLRARKVTARPYPALRDLPTHLEPLRGPAIVHLFLPNRPLRDYKLHDGEEPDQGYPCQRETGEIADRQGFFAPLSIEEDVSEPFSDWLDARRFVSMPFHLDAPDTSCGHLIRTESLTKRWLHCRSQPKSLPLDLPSELPRARVPEEVKHVATIQLMLDQLGQILSVGINAAFSRVPMVFFCNHPLRTDSRD